MDSESYWLGVATAFAFMQADVDTEENALLGRDPVLRVRLPYVESPEPEDLERFAQAVDYLNEECPVLSWYLISTGQTLGGGEHTIAFGSTEGYQGLPTGMIPGGRIHNAKGNLVEKMVLFEWEVAELVRQKTGLRLQTTRRTTHLILEDNEVRSGITEVLYGPYLHDEETVMVAWARNGDHTSMQLLVRDCEGDWLNSNAEGAEQYDVGTVRING